MYDYQSVLDFWFYPPCHDLYGEKRPEWFTINPEFDKAIIKQFGTDFKRAENGNFLAWTDTKEGCLALILIFDQFSRNMFRETPKAFATDTKARELARYMVRAGFFDELAPFQKNFAALPFEHSEDLAEQIFSVKLFKSFGDDDAILYAVRHHDIIEKFARFPHRNKILGRQSTEDEIEFLKQPNSSF
ncbi:MAG: DUF924 domain-containing protein [Sneathiella sp.]|nr:DUF924 domain-containing protein [Sneathiella sp.]